MQEDAENKEKVIPKYKNFARGTKKQKTAEQIQKKIQSLARETFYF